MIKLRKVRFFPFLSHSNLIEVYLYGDNHAKLAALCYFDSKQ